MATNRNYLAEGITEEGFKENTANIRGHVELCEQLDRATPSVLSTIERTLGQRHADTSTNRMHASQRYIKAVRLACIAWMEMEKGMSSDE